MAEFLVKIADERGHVLEQLESGISEQDIRERFVQQGYLVYWVKSRGLMPGRILWRRRQRVKAGDFIIFNQQFLTLIKAGLPFLSALVMLTFLMTYVVPQFAELYATMGANLPAITVVMLGIGTTIRNYYYVILAILVVLAVAGWVWVRSERGSRTLDAIRYHLPVFGPIWMKYQVAMFSRTLATLLSGGLPLVPSLETASQSINSYKIAQSVEHPSKRLPEGRALAFSLEETEVFPDLAIEMVEVGESTGALPAMLNAVAEFFEEDVQNALSAALQLIEPIILIFMGVVVALVLISLYLPIFSLGAQVQQ